MAAAAQDLGVNAVQIATAYHSAILWADDIFHA